MTELRLCKDCKHYKKDWLTHIISFFGDRGSFDKCRREKNNNLVVGGCVKNYCEIERRNWSTLDVCGPAAKYFEARK